MSRCCPCATSSSSPALFLLPSVPASSTTTTTTSRVAFSPCRTGKLRLGTRPRSGNAPVAASGKDGSGTAEEEKGEGDPGSFNPFGFVTDNPSSRSAIQLPAVPAEDGNVGQMLYVHLMHGVGLLCSFMGLLLNLLVTAWLWLSEMPQPGYGFDYKEEEFHKAFDDLLGTLNITEPFFLVVQGFLVGSYGLTWALKNSSRILKLAILNSPLTVSSPVPGLFQQLKWPLFGEFTCQNAVLAERFIEAGSAYVLKLEKADVYRLPYLSSGAPGFALLEAARKVNFQDVLSRISAGFSSNSWEKPILLAWGISDKYLPLSVAEEFKRTNPNVVKLEAIEGAGHMPQEDWPEKVVKALVYFL